MIILKNITKAFGSKTVLDKFSYEFADKGIYALTGISGAGKTTLLRIICGLDKEISGSITGVTECSVAFQEYRLFDGLNALENTLLGIKKPRERLNDAKALLKVLGFNEDEMTLFPYELSGGMKQRVSLARALLADGNVLLLDEPTKELDSKLCDIVNSLIKDEGKRRTVIMITHRAADIAALNAKVLIVPKL